MIESQLSNTRVTDYKNSLANFTSLDITTTKAEAFKELMRDMKSEGYELRKLCKRLDLQTSVTKTTDFTGTISDRDYLERLKLVIVVTAVSGSGAPKFTLQGTDDQSSYEDIYTTSSITAAGTTTYDLSKVFKYYRLNLAFTAESTPSITYKGYLIETIYEDMHLYKTLSMLFLDLYKTKKFEYALDQSDYFDTRYIDLLRNTPFKFDEDDDGDISESEKESVYPVRFGL